VRGKDCQIGDQGGASQLPIGQIVPGSEGQHQQGNQKEQYQGNAESRHEQG